MQEMPIFFKKLNFKKKNVAHNFLFIYAFIYLDHKLTNQIYMFRLIKT